MFYDTAYDTLYRIPISDTAVAHACVIILFKDSTVRHRGGLTYLEVLQVNSYNILYCGATWNELNGILPTAGSGTMVR